MTLIATLMILWAVSPASASMPSGAEGAAGSVRGHGGGLERVGRLEVPGEAQVNGENAGPGALGTWLWPQGRRMYLLGGLYTRLLADPDRERLTGLPLIDQQLALVGHLADGGSAANRQFGFNELIAVDLDAGEVQRTAELEPAALYSQALLAGGTGGGGRPSQFRNHPLGQQEVVAVDRQQGRVFVAYGQSSLEPVRPRAGSVQGCAARQACVGGVHVLDGETLEALGQIPVTIARADGSPVAPRLLAMRYLPPLDDGGGKVVLLVEELAHRPAPGVARTGVGNSTNPTSRDTAPGPQYLVQLDLTEQRQEWAVVVEDCRGDRQTSSAGMAVRDLPGTAAVFRPAHERALWVGCYADTSRSGQLVRVPIDEEGMPGGLGVEPSDPQDVAREVLEEGPEAEPRPEWVARRPEGQTSWRGPDETWEFLADPRSGRMLLRSRATGDELWWIFDTQRRGFLGAIGIGDYRVNEQRGRNQPRAGFDETRGRLYVQTLDQTASGGGPAGWYVADVRGNPLGQAFFLRESEVGVPMLEFEPYNAMRIAIDSIGREGAPRVYAPASGKTHFEVVADHIPSRAKEVPAEERFAGRTLDIPEEPGKTAASVDGAARGFGFRAILVGGATGASRVGPVDPFGAAFAAAARRDEVPVFGGGSSGCLQDTREVVVAFVGPQGPATVDDGGSRGGAQPVVIDGRTRTDLEAPASRCGDMEWQEVWSSLLFSRPPLSEPSAPWMFESSQAECVSSDEPPEDSWTDELVGAFGAQVWCEDEEAGGRSEAQAFSLQDAAEGDLSDLQVSVTEAVARFHIYRDAERGLVARMESIARGVSIGEAIEIDTIRGSAEAWANGRAQPDTEADQGEGEPFNPHNCDLERSAGSCFDRHLFGVQVSDGQGGTAFACGPCGDERAAVEAIDARLGARGEARLRDPDPVLARGAPNGFQAGIVKPEFERFADLMINQDTLQTVVPTLEVIRHAPPWKWKAGTHPPGRQVYQFAGVEAATTYAIECLLWYDAANNVCTDPPVDPAELTVELEDADGQPLADGEFALHRDEGGDGVLDPAVDELVGGGACVTDGEGVCSFEGLLPGAYLVEQAGAPQGYAPVAEPFAVTLAPGVAQTVTFTNVADVATVAIELVDLDGAPIEGAEFALYPDVDGSGELPAGVETAGEHPQPLGDGVAAKTAAGDDGGGMVAASTAPAPVASCVTDAEGRCAMSVPPGPYILAQTHAPEGFAPIEPIAFELAQAGQTAEVAITNVDALGDGEQQAAPEPAPDLRVEDPPPAALPVIDDGPSVAQPQPAPEAAQPALPEGFGGTIVRVLRAPGALARFAVRSPMEAAAFAGVWLIWLSAAWLIWRRQRFVREVIGAPRSHEGSPEADGGQSREAGPLPGGDLAKPGAGGQRPADSGGGADTPAVAGFASAGPVLVDPPAPAAIPVPAGAATQTIRVVVATAEPSVATAVTRELAETADCVVVATAGSLAALREVLVSAAPDVLVLDLSLRNGDLWTQLATLHDLDRIVGLVPAHRALEDVTQRALDTGLRSLLAAADDLHSGVLPGAVRAVTAGQPAFGLRVQQVLVEAGREPHALPVRRGRKPVPGLTERQWEIARLALAGLTRAEIAERLVLSPRTVKRHLYDVRAKLGVTDPEDLDDLRRRLAQLEAQGKAGPRGPR